MNALTIDGVVYDCVRVGNDTWTVGHRGGDRAHTVEPKKGGCTCAARMYFRRLCKHIVALREWLGAQGVENMSTAIAKIETVEFMPALTVDESRRRHNALVQFVREQMQQDKDFGIIPGSTKPTLLKPGAEKLMTLFGLQVANPELVVRVEDWTGAEHGGEPLFYYLVRQQLIRHGEVIASQMGSCNSWETKYRYRQGERKCPACGKPAIIRGKEEYGGGWICFAKKGGCGAKFRTGDQTVESQQVGRTKNPDPADQVNTILKMAEKRALIAACLVAVNASEFFTQDLEDITTIDVTTDVVSSQPPAHRSQPAPPARPTSNSRQPPSATPIGSSPNGATPIGDDTLAVSIRQRLADYDRKQAQAGACQPGDLVRAVLAEAGKLGLPCGNIDDLVRWPVAALNNVGDAAASIVGAWKLEDAARASEQQEVPY